MVQIINDITLEPYFQDLYLKNNTKFIRYVVVVEIIQYKVVDLQN